MNKIGSTLTCEEERHSLKDCGTDCLTNTGCPGFYSNSTVKKICYLCRVSNSSEFIRNLNTRLAENLIVYLLQHDKIEPDISVNFENYSEGTIYGQGVV